MGLNIYVFVIFLYLYTYKLLDIDRYMKYCIIGNTNVGKSTFINMLVNRYECETGCTTYTKDVRYIDYNENILIDTPGFTYNKMTAHKFWNIYGDIIIDSSIIYVLISSDNIDNHDTWTIIKYLSNYTDNIYIIITKIDEIYKECYKKNKDVHMEIENCINIIKNMLVEENIYVVLISYICAECSFFINAQKSNFDYSNDIDLYYRLYKLPCGESHHKLLVMSNYYNFYDIHSKIKMYDFNNNKKQKEEQKQKEIEKEKQKQKETEKEYITEEYIKVTEDIDNKYEKNHNLFRYTYKCYSTINLCNIL